MLYLLTQTSRMTFVLIYVWLTILEGISQRHEIIDVNSAIVDIIKTSFKIVLF